MADKTVATDRIYVWDIVVRLCHVVFIIGVPSAYISYELDLLTWHFWNGYAVLAALVVRVIWGFCGGPHARFASFLQRPGKVWHYVRRWRAQPAPLGHNPLGGYAVLALLGVLAAQVGSGLFSDDGILNTGPLAVLVSADISEALTDYHEFNFFYLLLPLLVLHLTAVLAYWAIKKANLIKPMITGFKKL